VELNVRLRIDVCHPDPASPQQDRCLWCHVPKQAVR
jgi:hypothetical protein